MRKLLLSVVALLCAVTTNLFASEGALSGQFTINAAGDKIAFSQGNLQYQASTKTWRFAENQYDTIGAANENISSTYDGWIDLFGWGTGSNPMETSTDYNDYATFTDWGINKISNGGNEANLWHTLTKDEWVYLFYGRTNAATLFGLGSVNGVEGTILLPDNWVLPTGASFTASTPQGLRDKGKKYENDNGDNYSHNTYTAEQWAVMESAGAVFLPAAGRREAVVSSVGYSGGYWSATSNDTYTAYELYFNSYLLYPQDYYYRYYGQSVRLVQPYESEPQVEVNALPGKFSVAEEKKIQFSQGNLQYQASSEAWRFAENQYDIIGEANKNISASYSDWIDLFGWGTGNNPTNTSTNVEDYSTFTDWGTNAIANGGNIANAWYTLTGDEWEYLFFTRPNAATLFGLGAVNGQNGVILLPDNWTLPAGAAFTPSTEKGMVLDGTNTYKNSSGGNYTDNTYTATEWKVMEAAGAVFLPAAGARSGNTVVNEGSGGYYWTPTFPGTLNADAVFFLANVLDVSSIDRFYGCSVRLVRDASEDDTKEGSENVRRNSATECFISSATARPTTHKAQK